MADGGAFLSPPETSLRRTFLIEAAAGDDVLLRVLGPFAVQAARIRGLTAMEHPRGVSIRLEVSGLTEDRAEHLATRLRAMAAVTTVALGWRTPVPAE